MSKFLFSRFRQDIAYTMSHINKRRTVPKERIILCKELMDDFLKKSCALLGKDFSKAVAVKDYLKMIPDDFVLTPELYALYEKWEDVLLSFDEELPQEEQPVVLMVDIDPDFEEWEREDRMYPGVSRWDRLNYLKGPQQLTELAT